jgi:hypothetical protein
MSAVKADMKSELPYASREDALLYLMHEVVARPLHFMSQSRRDAVYAFELANRIQRATLPSVQPSSTDNQPCLQLTGIRRSIFESLVLQFSFHSVESVRWWQGLLQPHTEG